MTYIHMFLLNSYNVNFNVYNKLNDMEINANNLFKNALNVVSINNELLEILKYKL